MIPLLSSPLENITTIQLNIPIEFPESLHTAWVNLSQLCRRVNNKTVHTLFEIFWFEMYNIRPRVTPRFFETFRKRTRRTSGIEHTIARKTLLRNLRTKVSNVFQKSKSPKYKPHIGTVCACIERLCSLDKERVFDRCNTTIGHDCT